MLRVGIRQSGFSVIVCLSCAQGACDKAEPSPTESAPSQTTRPHEIELPEYYGIYVEDRGALHEIKETSTLDLTEDAKFLIFSKAVALGASNPKLYKLKPWHPTSQPSAKPKPSEQGNAELWQGVHQRAYDNMKQVEALGSGVPTGAVPVATRSKPVEGKPEMMWIVPATDLEPGYYCLGSRQYPFSARREQFWKQIASESPGEGPPWFELGMAYMDDNKLDDAERCFKTAIDSRYDPEGYSLAWNSLGVVHMKRGEYRKAIECFGKSININPKNHTPHFNIAMIMMITAEQKFAKDRKWDMEVLGKAHMAYSKAIECYQMYTWAYLERGKCLMKMATARLTANDASGAASFLQAALTDFDTIGKLEPANRFVKEAESLKSAVREQQAKLPSTWPATSVTSAP